MKLHIRWTALAALLASSSLCADPSETEVLSALWKCWWTISREFRWHSKAYHPVDTAKKAISSVKNITREVKVGEIFQGRVTRILDFGAFLEILPGQEGLLHISELAPGRVEKVRDVIKEGSVVPVKVISIDEQGRINLSLKAMGGSRGFNQRKDKKRGFKKK